MRRERVINDHVYVSGIEFERYWSKGLKCFRYPGKRYPVVITIVRVDPTEMFGKTWLEGVHLRVYGRDGDWRIEDEIG